MPRAGWSPIAVVVALITVAVLVFNLLFCVKHQHSRLLKVHAANAPGAAGGKPKAAGLAKRERVRLHWCYYLRVAGRQQSLQRFQQRANIATRQEGWRNRGQGRQADQRQVVEGKELHGHGRVAAAATSQCRHQAQGG